MEDAWERLKVKLAELQDVYSALALLHWDQAVAMPRKGGPGRARALATMEGMAHRRLTDPEIGDLLAALEEAGGLDEVAAASVRVLRREYDRATRLPEDLVRALAHATGLAYQAWTEAKPRSDFGVLRPHLERVVELKRQQADAIGWTHERYDALLVEYEPDATAAGVAELFTRLVDGLLPIVDTVLGAVGDRPELLFRPCDPARQIEFCTWLVERLGFDMDAGVMASSPHPFTTTIGPGDVRQTTMARERYLVGAVYASIHETGHALYEQGIPEEWVALPVGRPPSFGMHESQSRLWENHVGRSRPFVDWVLPHLKERFPSALGMVTPGDFYRAVNHAGRTLVRVDADELTYNLHVVFRFELELALYRDDVAVADLPEAWNDKMEAYLGVRPDADRDGVLQDMHWAVGHHGYFPTYTLGTLYAADLYDAAVADLGDLSDRHRAGDFSDLLAWLREKVHERAWLEEAGDLARRVAGRSLSPEPFLSHLRSKYGELYAVSP